MKRKIIAATLAAAIMAGSAITASAAHGNAFEGYPVTVHDWDTPAVFAAGKDWPITTWYFYDADGQVLGSISNNTVMQIARMDGTDNVDWESWLTSAFNDYRDGESKSPTSVSGRKEQPEAFDAESLALEVIELTNAERERHGLEPLHVDSALMELAMTRAEEVSRKYSHERPDGTRISLEYGCGENVGAKATPEKQVASWMNSDGHRRNILLERYVSIGVGCYKADNGKTYWVQVFGT